MTKDQIVNPTDRQENGAFIYNNIMYEQIITIVHAMTYPLSIKHGKCHILEGPSPVNFTEDYSILIRVKVSHRTVDTGRAVIHRCSNRPLFPMQNLKNKTGCKC